MVVVVAVDRQQPAPAKVAEKAYRGRGWEVSGLAS